MQRKKLAILLILGIIILSCNNSNKVDRIIHYIQSIDSRKDLTESVTEFETLDKNDKEISGFSIYELTDNDGVLHRLIADVAHPNELPGIYEFYYKNDTLTFARIMQFDELGIDTIIDSDYYFDRMKLIKKFNRKRDDLDSEIVLQASEFYLIYGNLSTE